MFVERLACKLARQVVLVVVLVLGFEWPREATAIDIRC
jgi:hypothetical protein